MSNATVQRVKPQEKPTRRPGFEAEAVIAIGSLRNALEALVARVGVEWENPNDLASQLRISKNLAWKISKVMTERDPMAALPLIPGRDAFEILIKKATARGVDSGSVLTLRQSLRELDEFAEQHAGDRASLELLAAGCGSDQESSIAMNHRKAAFAGNGFIWGVQAGVMHKLSMLRESRSHPGRIDMALISGLISLRKTKPIGSWVVARSKAADDRPKLTAAGVPAPTLEPLDPGVPKGGVPMIMPFCSDPMPTVRNVPTSDGAVEHRIEGWPVGDSGAITVFAGQVVRSFGDVRRSSSNDYAASISRISTPTEVLVIDMFVQRGLYGDASPTLHFVSDLGMPLATGVDEGRELAIPGRVTHMGRGARCASCRAVPRCGDLAQTVFGWLGWDGDEFDLYRAEVRYPPIATSAIMRIPLRV